MHVLLAPGELGEVLGADAVAAALATGWRRHDPTAVVDLAPLAPAPADAAALQDLVDASDLVARAEKSELLVTVVDLLDTSALQGSVVRGVAWVAQRTGRPCVVIAGRVLLGRREYAAAGVDAAYALAEPRGPAGDPAEVEARLAGLAERVARSWTPRPA